MEPRPCVAYYRVSTAMQGRSGLGLEAQRQAVQRYLSANQGRLLEELTEVESGRKDARPMFARALWLCRVYDARLVIARLDRLSRSTALIAGLMESRVDFVAADMPMANRFTLHILAAVAEYESKLISERVKAALAVAKAHGKKRGGPQRPDFKTYFVGGTEASNIASRKRALRRASDVKAILCDLRDAGETNFGIARRLTESGVIPPNGGAQWSPMTIKRMFKILGEPRPRPYHRNYVPKGGGQTQARREPRLTRDGTAPKARRRQDQ